MFNILEKCSPADTSRRNLWVCLRDYTIGNNKVLNWDLVQKVVDILNRAKVSTNVEFCSNWMNPVSVSFNEYVLKHEESTPSLSGSWGDELKALRELAAIGVTCWAGFSGEETLYKLDVNADIVEEWIPDPGC